MCAKFQLDSSTHSQVIAKNAKWVKRIRKNEEIILEFWSLVLRDWLAQFASNLIFRFAYVVRGHISSKFG